MREDSYKEYYEGAELNHIYKRYAWETAIGLQKVDGLKTSKYLVEIANKNIDGEISLDEFIHLINTYYDNTPNKEKKTEEADKVTTCIV